MHHFISPEILQVGTSTIHVIQSGGNNSWLAILVTIASVVGGWIISLVLQKKNLSDQQKNQIKYDIYKQVIKIHQENQDSLSKLSVVSSTPFIMMDSCLIGVGMQPFNKTQPQAMQEGWKYWNDHVKEGIDNYFEFVANYQRLLYLIEDWAGPLKNLHHAQELLTKEISACQKVVFSQLSEWQTVSIKRGYDWTKWDRDEIKQEGQVIHDRVIDMTTYLSDFLILVHNELMAEYFDYKHPIRKPRDLKYKVLTKRGFLNKDQLDAEDSEEHRNENQKGA